MVFGELLVVLDVFLGNYLASLKKNTHTHTLLAHTHNLQCCLFRMFEMTCMMSYVQYIFCQKSFRWNFKWFDSLFGLFGVSHFYGGFELFLQNRGTLQQMGEVHGILEFSRVKPFQRHKKHGHICKQFNSIKHHRPFLFLPTYFEGTGKQTSASSVSQKHSKANNYTHPCNPS